MFRGFLLEDVCISVISTITVQSFDGDLFCVGQKVSDFRFFLTNERVRGEGGGGTKISKSCREVCPTYVCQSENQEWV